VNAGGAAPDVPRDAFWPAGFMGQNTVIIPSLRGNHRGAGTIRVSRAVTRP
jgi:hypothetical protein